MNDGLPTDLMISAKIRLAAQDGVSLYVINKGDPTSGAILLKVNTLDGVAQVYSQVNLDGKKGWAKAFPKPAPEAEADAYVASQVDFDPDLWVIEVEDRKGRLWFEGPVLDI